MKCIRCGKDEKELIPIKTGDVCFEDFAKLCGEYLNKQDPEYKYTAYVVKK